MRRGGDAALAGFRRCIPRRKPDGTEVTDADEASEAAIVEVLQRRFPGYGIVGEEGVSIAPRDGFGTFYVDPIDGTSAFLDGLAHWGPTICLVEDGKLRAGGLLLPRMNELWYAERDHGAWRDGERLQPEDPGEPGRHHSLYLPSRYHRAQPIAWPGKVRALGSSAVHLAMVAGGGGLATILPRWKLWDVGCGILLVEQAGRIVTTFDGGPLDPLQMEGRPFLAGKGAIIHYSISARSA